MEKYDLTRLQLCPLCGGKMQGDLILKDGRGVNASSVKSASPDEIAGYGFFCLSCERGWTGDDLASRSKPADQDKRDEPG